MYGKRSQVKREKRTRRAAQMGTPMVMSGTAMAASSVMPSGAPTRMPSCQRSFFLRLHGRLPQNVQPDGLRAKHTPTAPALSTRREDEGEREGAAELTLWRADSRWEREMGGTELDEGRGDEMRRGEARRLRGTWRAARSKHPLQKCSHYIAATSATECLYLRKCQSLISLRQSQQNSAPAHIRKRN